jgi:ABC-type branched-subunit amino acid transport system ATPase component
MSHLIINSISKKFGGVQALMRVSLDVQSGKITGLVGPNGSGKTTLLNCISGTITPDSGHVEYEGNRISDNPSVAYYGGSVRTFQSARVFPQLTVLENLLLIDDDRSIIGSLVHSKKQKDQEYDINQVLEKFGILEKKNDLAGDLSYGQKKLVELARVVLADKHIILLDEPFAGLFPKVIQYIISIIKELREQGKMVILVEHNPRIIHELCDSVVVLDAGELLATGTPEHVFNLSSVREAYLGE